MPHVVRKKTIFPKSLIQKQWVYLMKSVSVHLDLMIVVNMKTFAHSRQKGKAGRRWSTW